MDDALECPICGNKLSNIKLPNKLLRSLDKTSDYVARHCISGRNHFLSFYVDENTGQVDFLKISLNPKYSRYIEIDFVNQKCRITCLKNSQPQYIAVDKMIHPDFPLLKKLRERVSLFVTFS
jgi:hypothetical protein